MWKACAARNQANVQERAVSRLTVRCLPCRQMCQAFVDVFGLLDDATPDRRMAREQIEAALASPLLGSGGRCIIILN